MFYVILLLVLETKRILIPERDHESLAKQAIFKIFF